MTRDDQAGSADHERVIAALESIRAGGRTIPAIVAAMKTLVAAVRADERRAVVDLLVQRYGASCRLHHGIFTGEAFAGAIEDVENGAHEASR